MEDSKIFQRAQPKHGTSGRRQFAPTPDPDGIRKSGISDSAAARLPAEAKPGSGGEWKAPSPASLQSALPQYEVISFIARGGMGAVYKGRHTRLDRLVAIKVLPVEGQDQTFGYAARFRQEAWAMAHLNHPCIVPVHDSGETPDGLLYFVMDFVDGRNVDQLIAEQGRLAPKEAARIVDSLCDALAYAHSHGVIHRDIKPSNIIVTPDGEVKVADFGLAKLPLASTTVPTTADVTIGTVGFMAPESFDPTMKVDGRADIFAVGAMLYQMLTGQKAHGVFEMPSKIVPGLDARFDAIVDRAMKSDRDARYASATDLRADVAQVLAEPVPPPRGSKARMLVAACIIAALVFAGVAWPHRKRPGALPDTDGGAGYAATLPAASSDKPFINTLGMEFVPVPQTAVLFSRWEARVKDYAAFARANTVDHAWKTQRKEQIDVAREPEHPVAGTSWDDANAFCKWLTEKETAAGRLHGGAHYRLPTDEEWSRAVGLASEVGATPKERTGNNGVDFPWGIGFPPPKAMVGNYADSAFHENFQSSPWIEGYRDGFATTAPVGSFPPNEYGLHDLGGNVWEWCEDFYEPGGSERVMRGGSWVTYGRNSMASAFRLHAEPDSHSGTGFRCVLAMRASDESGASAPAATQKDGPPAAALTAPAHHWVNAFPDLEKLPVIAESDKGWVRCKSDAPSLLVPSATGGDLLLSNGGVRARFHAGTEQNATPARLELRRDAALPACGLRYIPGAPGENAELRIELDRRSSRRMSRLASIQVTPPLAPGAEFVMEFIAIGDVLFGRLNGLTVMVRVEGLDLPLKGALGIVDADHFSFRDVEVFNLDSVPEAEALKIAGLDDATIAASRNSSIGGSYPPGVWVKPFANLPALPNMESLENGWVRRTCDSASLLATTGIDENFEPANGGVRVRFREPPASEIRRLKPQIRRKPGSGVLEAWLVPPGESGGAWEMQIVHFSYSHGGIKTKLVSAPLQAPLQEGIEYGMEMYAIGDLVIARLNGQTLTAKLGAAEAPPRGGLGVFGVDRNFFRDFEVMNLDGLPESEALKLAGAEGR